MSQAASNVTRLAASFAWYRNRLDKLNLFCQVLLWFYQIIMKSSSLDLGDKVENRLVIIPISLFNEVGEVLAIYVGFVFDKGISE